jgi:hypothetical protein
MTKVGACIADSSARVVILAGEALEIVGIAKKIMLGRIERSAYWMNHDPTGLQPAPKGKGA